MLLTSRSGSSRRSRLPIRSATVRVVAALLFSAVDANAESLRLEGSDFVQSVVSRLVESADFLPGSSGLEVRLQGSAAAYHLLREGRLELGLLFDDGERLAELEGYRKLPVAYLVAQVVVHERNPLESIRLDRLGGIFGAAEGIDLRRWGDLGALTWSDRVIRPIRVDATTDLSTAYFQQRVLRVPRYKEQVRVESTPSHVLDAVRGQEAAIGLAGLLPARREGWKVLSIEPNPGDPPIAPEPGTVHFGHYPLRLPLVLVFPEAKQAEWSQWILPFFSEEFAEILHGAGYFPLPRSVRERLRLELTFGN